MYIYIYIYINIYINIYKLTSSPAHLFAIIRGKRKIGPEHFKHVMQICPNRGHIFSE